MSEKPPNETEGNLAKVLDLSPSRRDEDPKEVIHRVVDQCLINMVFQPIVDLGSGKIFAYEALCRSRVPQFETPPEMIEVASEEGRIGELGRLQRSLACRNCPDWPIFVNISPNEFDEPWLVRPDDPIFLHRHEVFIEITESVPLVFFEQCHSVLAELRRKGARLAIDDLGAGYSNLKYIADLAPDIVKLDRDLVAGCRMDSTQYELLRSISKLCREVNAKVVAEGVETAEELEAVSSAGIDYCQGFFLGRPKATPSDLTWPASEMVASDSMKARVLSSRATHSEVVSAEDSERRLDELETARSLLEKSVRKARGEVVRLRKALSRAESQHEKAQSRLGHVESSLVESEKNRKKLAQLFEQAVLRNDKADAAAEAEKKPERSRLRTLAGHGAIWAAGVLAGLGLYVLEPRIDRSVAVADAPFLTRAAEQVAAPVAPEPAATSEPDAVDPMERVEEPEPVAVAEVEAPVTPDVESAPELAAEPVADPVSASPVPAAPPAEEAAMAQVEGAVSRWAESWSAQDVERYLGSYAPGFVSDNGLSGRGLARAPARACPGARFARGHARGHLGRGRESYRCHRAFRAGLPLQHLP